MTKTKPEMPKPRYYDRRRAAAYRGLSVMSIIRLEKEKQLTPLRQRPGGKVFYSDEEVEAPPPKDPE